MPGSTHAIRTTHAGALQRPQELSAAMQRGELETPRVQQDLAAAVKDVVRAQVDTGIDIVDDGEYGKTMWEWYVTERLTGFERRPWEEAHHRGRDRTAFADFYAYADGHPGVLFYTEDEYFFSGIATQPICVGPLAYDPGPVRRDIANLRAAMDAAGAEEGFMPVVAPASIELGVGNEHYGSREELLWALAEVMREEYRAIIDAGFTLQVDDAWVPAAWDRDPDLDRDTWRRYALGRVEALNHALRGLPEDRIRYHLCWGSWHGPHAFDIGMADLVDIMLSVPASAYVFEAANPRHEHEYHIWEDVALPDGKALIPGVVTHSTNIVEHPELVAERIGRFAERVGARNVIAGTDCGMGSRVHPQIGWAKLESLVEGARLASGRVAA